MNKLLSEEEIESYRQHGMVVDIKEAYGDGEYDSEKTFIPPEYVDTYLLKHGYHKYDTAIAAEKAAKEKAAEEKAMSLKRFLYNLKEVYSEDFGYGKFGDVKDIELMEQFKKQCAKKLFTNEEEKIIWLIIQNAICKGNEI